MALVADATAPGNGGGAQNEVVANLAQLMQQQQNSSSAASDPANIPLWMIRPTAPQSGSGGALSSAAADHAAHDPGSLIRDIASVGSYAGVSTPQTKAFAEQYWLDMPDGDKKAFAEAAISAEMWKPTDGAFGLAHAWTQAVSLAQQYNANHGTDKWVSPFEAVKKLAPAVAASKQAAYNGFTQTTRVHQFRESDLYSQAKSILQNELGRDPSKEELRAFTIAVNAAAKKNPEIVTTQQQNPDGTGENQAVTYGGQFDPTQTIDEMVKKTDEHARYQAAVDYFPAVMQALGAVVS